MIVGTAGHIDHGKTTLVRALTGVDTDRLKEEKARGISIELGYAYTPLDNGDALGFIDVPGHERFVHTMVAGACGIDFALLVIAADDGVMPQTREHLAVLELLGVARGAVALTKIDRVSATRLHEVQVEVTRLLAPTALGGAPMFMINATAAQDPGTDSLRRYLHAAAMGRDVTGTCAVACCSPAGNADGLLRLAVDRVFTLAGLGTLVTGTVFSGCVRTGDTVAVMPANKPSRVRSIHTQNRASEAGHAGQRCALNLVGIDRDEVARGDWVADQRALVPTTRVDVRLGLLADCAHRVAAWTPLHFHIGTAHRVAHSVLLESEHLSAGQSARVQLVFDTAICAVPGDRFIARDAQATRTVGGGVVLDPRAPARKRRSIERLKYLAALEQMVAGEGMGPVLQESPLGLKMTDLVRLSGKPPERVPVPPEALTIEAGHDRVVVLPAHWRAVREHAVAALRTFHEHTPDEPGPDIGRLRRIAQPDMPDALWRTLIDALVAERLILRSGPWLHLPGHAVTLSEADQALALRLQPRIASGRFDPPWVRELAAAVHEPEERVRQVLRKQVTRGSVYQVVHDLFYDSQRVGELAEVAATLAGERGELNAAQYRDAIGLGRKRTIQILEFFDRVGYTRRVRDSHVLRKDSGWLAARRDSSG
ncbi:MAG: selenocysteine-specific translation elongation factor [Gammaproteobacteria bacterium]|nr:MAG: selenocysteine-specific translation elongation factor [Gammaproteobacteria bacterium]